MKWYEVYECEIWSEFASRFPPGDLCRSILSMREDGKIAAKMIADNYRRIGITKTAADKLRSKILNCK